MAFTSVALQLTSGLEEIQNATTYIRNGAYVTYLLTLEMEKVFVCLLQSKQPSDRRHKCKVATDGRLMSSSSMHEGATNLVFVVLSA